MNKDVEKVLKNYFVKRKHVLCVYLFGSTAVGRENKFSDVDVAVLFDAEVNQEKFSEESLSIMDDLSSILNKDVDVIILNKSGSFLKYQIFKNGLRVYERWDRVDHSFEVKTIMEYFDFFPVRQRLEKALINCIKGG